MDIAIIVATHKEYPMPKDDMYLPLHVGACAQASKSADDEKITEITGERAIAKWDAGYKKDDEGDNISYLNPSFCELTGLYWAWKNLDAAYLGLVQYRRHFSLKKGKNPEDVLKRDEIEGFIPEKKIFVPKKRKYYIETLYSHYAHTHYAVQLDATRSVIERLYPEYIKAYDKVLNMREGHMFNMMIMQKDMMDDYCRWLFDILFALKDELGAKKTEGFNDPSEDLDFPELSDFQSRFYGRISEIIFNVWLMHHIEKGIIKPDDIMELGFINLEGENWGRKIFSFLKAKFFGEKYERSF